MCLKQFGQFTHKLCFFPHSLLNISDALISILEHGYQDLAQDTETEQSDNQHLEFSASVELSETLNSFLPVHHGCHGGAVLRDKNNNTTISHNAIAQRFSHFLVVFLWEHLRRPMGV